MKEQIKKNIGFIFAFVMVASIIAVTYSSALAYDEPNVVVPLWEEEVEADNANRD